MVRKYPIVRIEDVVEPYLRRNSVLLCDYAPDIADEWCYRKNCGFGPEHFSYGSGVMAWWTCSTCQRDYEQQINNRTHGHGCPYCGLKRVTPETCLATRAPLVAKEFHPTKNGKLTAKDVFAASNKTYWWKCGACGYSYKASPSDRTGSGSGCRRCYENSLEERRNRPRPPRKRLVVNGKKPISRKWYEQWDYVPLSKTHPKLVKQWHPTKNGNLRPQDFSSGSDTTVWWKCAKGPDHEWQAPIYSRTGKQPRGCPFCDGKKASVTNSLASLYPKLGRQWHELLNGGIRAEDVTARSGRRFWWRCDSCDHVFSMIVSSRTLGQGKCPSCGALPGAGAGRKNARKKAGKTGKR